MLFMSCFCGTPRRKHLQKPLLAPATECTALSRPQKTRIASIVKEGCNFQDGILSMNMKITSVIVVIRNRWRPNQDILALMEVRAEKALQDTFLR